MECKYISDLHLYDSYSLDWRPQYDNLDLYAIDLLDTWNAFTQDDDIVIIVGDIGHNCPRTLDVLKRLKGVKILVVGNHDLLWGRDLYTCKVFNGIHQFINSNGVYVRHKPDGNRGLCTYYIHGHHHRYDMPGMGNMLRLYSHDTYRLNCSADLVNNKPCTIRELILKKEILLDKCRELKYL